MSVSIATRTGYKHTPLGWIPEEWEIAEVKAISSVLGGFAFKSEDFGDEGIPVLRISDIQNSEVVECGKFVSPELNVNEKFEVKRNDLVIALSGATTGKIGTFKCERSAWLNQRVGKFTPTLPSDREFVSLLIQTNNIQHHIRLNSIGGAQPNISTSQLEDLVFFCPPPREREAIATLLSTWDEAIEKTKAIIAQLQQRHRGLMQQLLTGKTRLPGFEGEWVRRDLSELLIPIRRRETWDDDKLYDLISVRRRSGGVFYRESLLGHQILTKTLQKVETGDFLISKMQIVHGASGLVTKDFDGFYVSNSYLILKGERDVVDMGFFNYYSQLPQFYHLCFTSSYGVHIEKMTFDFDDFLSRNIEIPSDLSEQQAIAAVLTASETEIALHQTRSAALKAQKKGLMQKLLTGEWRLPQFLA